MNIAGLKQMGGRTLGKSALVLKRYAPEILVGAGIIGTVTAAVMGAKATLKLEETVDQGQLRLEMTQHRVDKGEATQREVTRAYVENVVDVVKLYGPSATLLVASVACTLGGHGLLRKRNAALVAAYKVLETTYSNYRARVTEEFGEDVDRDFHLGLRNEERVNEETGKKEIVKVANKPTEYSSYARFFDELNPNWTKYADQNLYFLKAQQNYFNDLLQARGHVFLSEVYDALGIERSRASIVVGWTISKNDGDNVIDWGLHDVRNRDFVNGLERSILLDFNVDGVIIDKLDD